MMSFEDTTIHVIDFEGSLHTGVLEYGVVSLKGLQITEIHTGFCQARAAIPKSEYQTHKLSEAQLFSYPRFEAQWELFAQLRAEGPFAAHNAVIENSFLKNTWPHCRLSTDFARPKDMTITWGPFIDTLKLARVNFPEMNSFSLQNLLQKLNLTAPLQALAEKYCPKNRRTFHCALFDSLGAGLLLIACAQTYPNLEALFLEDTLQGTLF